MKYVVSLSGGKDSTAMLLMLLERNMPVDEIVFCDTGVEFPDMYNHIKQLDDYIKQHYNKYITVLKADKPFEYWFTEHVKTAGKNKGQKGYGWASMRVRWCTKRLKSEVVSKYLKSIKDYKLYIGIAYDEPKRHQKIANNVIHPLYDWKITEQECLNYCYSKGFKFGGLYEIFGRTSCYLCPLQSVPDWRKLYFHYPHLFDYALRLEETNPDALLPNDYRLEELKDQFDFECKVGKEFKHYPRRDKRKIHEFKVKQLIEKARRKETQ